MYLDCNYVRSGEKGTGGSGVGEGEGGGGDGESVGGGESSVSWGTRSGESCDDDDD